MDKRICKNCRNYNQHYSFDSRKLFRIYCGHCVLKVKKCVKPDDAACEHYVFTEGDETAFANKEYLSKELLRYILQLELLPAIEDMLKEGGEEAQCH